MQLFVLGCVVSLVVYLGQFLLLLQAVSSQGCREVSGEQLEFLGLVKKTPGLVKGDLGLGCGCYMSVDGTAGWVQTLASALCLTSPP